MEEDNVKVPEAIEEVEKPEKKKKAPARGKMTPAKVDNLEKARAAKKIYAVERHSKGFRPAAEAKIEKEIQDRAEKLAKDILEEEKRAKELAEYEEWKKNKGKEPPPEVEKPQAKAKAKPKAKPKVSAAPKKVSAAPKPKVAKAASEEVEEPDDGYYGGIPFPFVRTTAMFNIDDFID